MFWGEISRSFNYNTSLYKCIFIKNPCIRVAQCIFVFGLFARDDSINVSQLSELYFMSCMMNGIRIDPEPFLGRQLFSVATSTKGRIVIRAVIKQFLGIESNLND